MSSQLDPAVGRDDHRSRPKIRQPQRREFHAPKESSGQANEHRAKAAEPQEALQRLEMLASRER